MALDDLLVTARALMADFSLVPKLSAAVAGARIDTSNPSGHVAKRVPKCYRCGGAHVIKNCNAKADIKCWECDNTGHISRHCPNKNKPSEN